MHPERARLIGEAVNLLAELGLPSDPYALRGRYDMPTDGAWRFTPDGSGALDIGRLIGRLYPGDVAPLYAVKLLMCDDALEAAGAAGDMEAVKAFAQEFGRIAEQWILDDLAERGRKVRVIQQRGGREKARAHQAVIGDRDRRIVKRFHELSATGYCREAAAMIAREHRLSASTVRKIIRRGNETRAC